MHFSTPFVGLLAGFAAAAASLVIDPHVLHEKRDGAPIEWERQTRASKEVILPIRIGLKQRNLHYADHFIEEVADPDSPKYGVSYTDVEDVHKFGILTGHGF